MFFFFKMSLRLQDWEYL